MRPSSFKRFTAGFLSFSLLFTQVLFADNVEKNLWEQRRKAVQPSSGSQPLLAQLTGTLPMGGSRLTGGYGAAIIPSSVKKFQKTQSPASFSKLANLVSLLSKDGIVRSIQPGKGPATIVCIQDIHGLPEAQKNISSMILNALSLDSSAVIGLEGAAGAISMAPFRTANQNTNKELGSFFLNAGLITGAEYAGFAAASVPSIIGLENEALYLKNADAVKASLKQQKARLKEIGKEKKAAHEKKMTAYTPAMITLDQKWADYQSGALNIGDYLSGFSSVSSYPSVTSFLKTWTLEKTIDFKKAEQERTRFLSQLVGKLNQGELDILVQQTVGLRSGAVAYADYYRSLKHAGEKAGVSLSETSEFNRYMAYVVEADSIQPDALLSDVSKLEKETWANLCKTPEQKEAYRHAFKLALKEKLVRLTMTPQEWNEYKSQVPRSKFQATLKNSKKQETNDLKFGNSDLVWDLEFGSWNLKSYEEFYEAAEARNDVLAKNLKLNIRDGVKTAVVVAGGFHSEGMNRLLANGEFTVITVSPKLVAVDGSLDNDYLSIFNRDNTPLEKLFEAPKLSIVKGLLTGTLGSEAAARALRMLSQEAPPVLERSVTEETALGKFNTHGIAVAQPGALIPAQSGTVVLEGTTGSGVQIEVRANAAPWWSKPGARIQSSGDKLRNALTEPELLLPAVLIPALAIVVMAFAGTLYPALGIGVAHQIFSAGMAGMMALEYFIPRYVEIAHEDSHNEAARAQLHVSLRLVGWFALAVLLTVYFYAAGSSVDKTFSWMALTASVIAGVAALVAGHTGLNATSILVPAVVPGSADDKRGFFAKLFGFGKKDAAPKKPADQILLEHLREILATGQFPANFDRPDYWSNYFNASENPAGYAEAMPFLRRITEASTRAYLEEKSQAPQRYAEIAISVVLGRPIPPSAGQGESQEPVTSIVGGVNDPGPAPAEGYVNLPDPKPADEAQVAPPVTNPAPAKKSALPDDLYDQYDSAVADLRFGIVEPAERLLALLEAHPDDPKLKSFLYMPGTLRRLLSDLRPALQPAVPPETANPQGPGYHRPLGTIMTANEISERGRRFEYPGVVFEDLGEGEFTVYINGNGAKFTNVTGFVIFRDGVNNRNHALYVRHLDADKGYAPVYARLTPYELEEVAEEELEPLVRVHAGVMTRDQIDRHIDAPYMAKRFRNGIGFNLEEGAVLIVEPSGGEDIYPVKNLVAFTVHNGRVYVKHLDSQKEHLPAYHYFTASGLSEEVSSENLPPEVAQEFGVQQSNVIEGVSTEMHVAVSAYKIKGPDGRDDIPAAQQMDPVISPSGREYAHTLDSDSRRPRVSRPGDRYREELTPEAKAGGAPVVVFPSGWVSSSIKNFRDIRKKGEREKNVPEFRAILTGTLEHLRAKRSPNSYERQIAEFLDVLIGVMDRTGLTAVQARNDRELPEGDHVEAQKKGEEEAKAYLNEKLSVLRTFIPALEKAPQLINYLVQAQGLYGEQAVLASYFRAFRLLGFSVFATNKKENVLRGLYFYRALFQAQTKLHGKDVHVFGLLTDEEHYLTDTGRRNYETSLVNLVAQGDPLVMKALEIPEGQFGAYVEANYDALVKKLTGKPSVGQSSKDVDQVGQSAMPDGFTALTLVAALDGEEIQRRGDKALKQATSIEDIHTKVGARYEWIIELFLKLAGSKIENEEADPVEITDPMFLTPVDRLYRALGVMLNVARTKFSKKAYALYQMLVVSDFILKAEETIKARMPAISIRTRGASPVRKEVIPKVYVPVLPTVYKEMAQATRAQFDHLEAAFRDIPNADAKAAREIGERLMKLEEIVLIFEGLFAETESLEGEETERPVAIRDPQLNERVFKNWIETGNIGNAKPVSAALQYFGLDRPRYEGWVNFVVGGAWVGELTTADGQRGKFSLYHVMRLFSRGGRSITTAELSEKIDKESNAGSFKTPAGVKQLFADKNVDYVDFFNPLDDVSARPTGGYWIEPKTAWLVETIVARIMPVAALIVYVLWKTGHLNSISNGSVVPVMAVIPLIYLLGHLGRGFDATFRNRDVWILTVLTAAATLPLLLLPWYPKTALVLYALVLIPLAFFQYDIDNRGPDEQEIAPPAAPRPRQPQPAAQVEAKEGPVDQKKESSDELVDAGMTGFGPQTRAVVSGLKNPGGELTVQVAEDIRRERPPLSVSQKKIIADNVEQRRGGIEESLKAARSVAFNFESSSTEGIYALSKEVDLKAALVNLRRLVENIDSSSWPEHPVLLEQVLKKLSVAMAGFDLTPTVLFGQTEGPGREIHSPELDNLTAELAVLAVQIRDRLERLEAKLRPHLVDTDLAGIEGEIRDAMRRRTPVDVAKLIESLKSDPLAATFIEALNNLASASRWVPSAERVEELTARLNKDEREVFVQVVESRRLMEETGGYWIEPKTAALVETVVARILPVAGLITYLFWTAGNLDSISIWAVLPVMAAIPLIYLLGHLGRGYDATFNNRDVRILTALSAVATLPLLLLPWYPVIALTLYGIVLIPLGIYHHRTDNRVEFALKILAQEEIFNDEIFRNNLLSDPSILDGFRFSDLIAHRKAWSPKAVAALIKEFYPKGNKHEFINVYPDEIQDTTADPKPIGIGAMRHVHPAAGDNAISQLRAETGKLGFVHAAVTAFIVLQKEDGSYHLISTVRAPHRLYGGRMESVTGGHIAARASIQSTIRKEVAEELGVTDIKEFKLIGYKRYENKVEDNTHDFVAVAVIGPEHVGDIKAALQEKRITLFEAGDVDEFKKYVPGQIQETTGKTVEQLAAEVQGEGDRAEVAYAVLAPVDATIGLYRELKATQGLTGTTDVFAWNSTDKEGNFLGNSEMVNRLLRELNLDSIDEQKTSAPDKHVGAYSPFTGAYSISKYEYLRDAIEARKSEDWQKVMYSLVQILTIKIGRPEVALMMRAERGLEEALEAVEIVNLAVPLARQIKDSGGVREFVRGQNEYVDLGLKQIRGWIEEARSGRSIVANEGNLETLRSYVKYPWFGSEEITKRVLLFSLLTLDKDLRDLPDFQIGKEIVLQVQAVLNNVPLGSSISFEDMSGSPIQDYQFAGVISVDSRFEKTDGLYRLVDSRSTFKKNSSSPKFGGYWIEPKTAALVETIVARILPVTGLIAYVLWRGGHLNSISIWAVLPVMAVIPLIYLLGHLGRGLDATFNNRDVRILTALSAVATLPLLLLPWYPVIALTLYGVVLIPLGIYHHHVDNRVRVNKARLQVMAAEFVLNPTAENQEKILKLINKIAGYMGMSAGNLEALRAGKAASNGAFEKMLVLVTGFNPKTGEMVDISPDKQKAIRDEIPAVIARNIDRSDKVSQANKAALKARIRTRTVDMKTWVRLLGAKVGEEMAEVLGAKTPKDNFEELADLMEVVNAFSSFSRRNADKEKISDAMKADSRVTMIAAGDFMETSPLVLSLLNSGKKEVTALKAPPGVYPEFYFDGYPKAVGISVQQFEAIAREFGIDSSDGVIDTSNPAFTGDREKLKSLILALKTQIPGFPGQAVSTFEAQKFATLKPLGLAKQKITPDVEVYANTHILDLVVRTKSGRVVTIPTFKNSPVISSEVEIIGVGPETVKAWGKVIDNSGLIIVLGKVADPKIAALLAGKNVIVAETPEQAALVAQTVNEYKRNNLTQLLSMARTIAGGLEFSSTEGISSLSEKISLAQVRADLQQAVTSINNQGWPENAAVVGKVLRSLSQAMAGTDLMPSIEVGATDGPYAEVHDPNLDSLKDAMLALAVQIRDRLERGVARVSFADENSDPVVKQILTWLTVIKAVHLYYGDFKHTPVILLPDQDLTSRVISLERAVAEHWRSVVKLPLPRSESLWLSDFKTDLDLSDYIDAKNSQGREDSFLVVLNVDRSIDQRTIDAFRHFIQSRKAQLVLVTAHRDVYDSLRQNSEIQRQEAREFDATQSGGYWIEPKTAWLVETFFARIVPVAALVAYTLWQNDWAWGLAGISIVGVLGLIATIRYTFKLGHLGRGYDATFNNPDVDHLTRLTTVATLPLLLLPWYPIIGLVLYGLALIPLAYHHYRVDNLPGKNVTKEADEEQALKKEEQVALFLAHVAGPLRDKLVEKKFDFKGAKAILNRRLAAQVERAQSDRKKVGDGKSIRFEFNNAFYLAGRAELSYADAKAILTQVMKDLGVGKVTFWMRIEFIRGRIVQFILRTILRSRRPFYDSKSAASLRSNVVVGFHADPLIDEELAGSELEAFTIEHAMRRIETFDAEKEKNRPQDVHVIRAASTDDSLVLNALKNKVKETLRRHALARGGKAAANIEAYLKKVYVEIEPLGLINPQRVLEEAEEALQIRSTNVRFQFYTAMPEQIDMNDPIVRFIVFSLLSGLRVLPISQQVEAAKVTSLNA